MTRPARDEEGEERISMEILTDAYGAEEEALSWYYYLSGALQFPFSARCTVRLATSPLEPGEEVKVIEMPPERECEHDMLVLIQWKRRRFAVPLM